MDARKFTTVTEDERDELRCDECRRLLRVAVLLGSPHFTGAAYVCLECLVAAAAHLRALGASEGDGAT